MEVVEMEHKGFIEILLICTLLILAGCGYQNEASTIEKLTTEQIQEEKFHVKQNEASNFLEEGQSYLYNNKVLYKAVRVPEENKVYIYENQSVVISTEIEEENKVYVYLEEPSEVFLEEKKIYIYGNETLISEPQKESVIFVVLPEEYENLSPIYPFTLHYRRQDFNITQKVDPTLQAKVSMQNHTFSYIKIGCKVTSSKLNMLSNLDVKILTYSNEKVYGVKLPLNRLSEIQNLPFVFWIGNFDPIVKFDKELQDFISINFTQKIPIQIKLFEKDTNLSEDRTVIKTRGYRREENGTLIEEITYGFIGNYGRILESININISHRYCKDYYTATVYPNATQEIAKLEFVDFIAYSPAERVI